MMLLSWCLLSLNIRPVVAVFQFCIGDCLSAMCPLLQPSDEGVVGPEGGLWMWALHPSHLISQGSCELLVLWARFSGCLSQLGMVLCYNTHFTVISRGLRWEQRKACVLWLVSPQIPSLSNSFEKGSESLGERGAGKEPTTKTLFTCPFLSYRSD